MKMKNNIFLASIFAVFVTGCSVIFPIPHDPEMMGTLVDVKIAIENTTCTDKNWSNLESKVERLKVYTEIRKDPQSNAVGELKEGIQKAKSSQNNTFCESVLRINKTRVNTIVEAWRGR